MREIANIELGVLASELSLALAGARFQKFYELSQNNFRAEFHSPGKGTLDLAMELKMRANLTKFITPAPESPTQFAMQARKQLEGAIAEKVSQAGTDRVLVFGFRTKTGPISLVLEMFSNGNLILLGENDKITACYRAEKWADREIRRGIPYVLPASGRESPFGLTAAKLKPLLNERKLIACLAAKVDLGASYLEEVIVRAGLDLNKPASGLDSDEINSLAAAFAEVGGNAQLSTYSPTAYVRDGKVFDYSLFPFKKYASTAGIETKNFASLSELLDFVFAPREPAACEKAPEPKSISEERKRLAFTLESQRSAVSRLYSEAEAAKATGDKIYGSYAEVEALLGYILSEKKRGASWDEIESKAASRNPIFARLLKKIDKGKGVVAIEL